MRPQEGVLKEEQDKGARAPSNDGSTGMRPCSIREHGLRVQRGNPRRFEGGLRENSVTKKLGEQTTDKEIGSPTKIFSLMRPASSVFVLREHHIVWKSSCIPLVLPKMGSDFPVPRCPRTPGPKDHNSLHTRQTGAAGTPA